MLLALQLVDSRRTTPGDVDGSSPSSPLQSFVKSPLKHDVHICLGMLLDRFRESSTLQRPVHGSPCDTSACSFLSPRPHNAPTAETAGILLKAAIKIAAGLHAPCSSLGTVKQHAEAFSFKKISHTLPGPLCHTTGVWQARAADRRFIGGALPRRLDGGAIGRIAAQLPWPICHGRWE